MKWAYSLRQKNKIALLFTVIFVLLFVKNMLDKQNFTELGETFSSVYEDRLLAESYIYKLSDHLSRKKILIDDCVTREDIARIKTRLHHHNHAIYALIRQYEKTKLTKEEEIVFMRFKCDLEKGFRQEARWLYQTDYEKQSGMAKKILNHSFYTSSNNLNLLSNIQIKEGEKLSNNSKKIVSGSANQNHFELSLLVVVGLLIHALIFASQSGFPKTPTNSSLN